MKIKKTDVELFGRLIQHHMSEVDIKICLDLPQNEFLRALIAGASEYLGRKITRKDFAKLAKISDRSVYSYFSSPDAVDYRVISEESRIAIIWYITTAVRNASPAETKQAPVVLGATRFYVVDGEMMSLEWATKALGYSHSTALSSRLAKNGIRWGDDISHLKNNRSKATIEKKFIVDGEQMNQSQAARALGYTQGGLSMRLRADGVQEGADISRYKRKNKKGKQAALEN
ncbi:hypothetical protein [Klebsiella quasivariicola]|uniref:hypothetical protein n=1 Tax=Klebsiella quasivariicola TaxID=2026240 RepID=UPI0024797D97|nr:hypothetical protein [Klebsiella quasivariicola]